MILIEVLMYIQFSVSFGGEFNLKKNINYDIYKNFNISRYFNKDVSLGVHEQGIP